MNGRPARRSRVLRSVVAALFTAAWPASFAARPSSCPMRSPAGLDARNSCGRRRLSRSRAISEGITRPKKVTSAREDRKDGRLENPEERDGDTLDQWRFEIAAYRLDKLLRAQYRFRRPSNAAWTAAAPARSLWVGRTLQPGSGGRAEHRDPPEAEGAFNDAKYTSLGPGTV